LHISPNIIRVIKSRRMRVVGHVARMGEMRIVYNILVRKRERQAQLGRHRRRWEGNIRMYLREIVWSVWTGSIWLMIGTNGDPL